MIKITDEEIIEAAKSSITMGEAAIKLKIHFNTFKKHALRLNVYKPNTGLKGTKKSFPCRQRNVYDVIQGKHPEYQTYKLKKKLYEHNIKENKCEECGIADWNDKPLECELDHIDGDSSNHILENLRILCPNCHSQTSTFRSKKRNSI